MSSTTKGVTKVDRFKYWIIGMINGIETKDLFQMIRDNDVPLLFEYELPPYFNWVKGSIIEKKDEIIAALTYENVVKYSGEFRPDLKALLEHDRGREWTERFLKVIVFMIENIELSAYEMKTKFTRKIRKIQQGRVKELDAIHMLEEKEQLENKEQLKIDRDLERERLREERKEKKSLRRRSRANRQLKDRDPPKKEETETKKEEEIKEEPIKEEPIVPPKNGDNPLLGMY